MSEHVILEGFDEDGYDAVVVGSGYGGSVVACRLSMAGVKVCLVEKGRRWEAKDFPTNSLEMMKAFRMENRDSRINFGPNNALFQVYMQEDSLAAMACGLGGGSLVNAGVMLRTPVRAKRNPKWPKEWERDWEICEASASSMLRTQSIPIKFPNAKIMEQIVGEGCEEISQIPLKLSVNFDVEELPSNSGNSNKTSSCIACGNCLSGCPYNAKNSTDKNYLASAIEAGCSIKTECQVQYVVKNPYDDDDILDEENTSKKKRRRWLVFFNETDYITSDFVILSGGVFGTVKILFESKARGLRISERLGLGLSCNGNNVAYLAGSSAPLKAYGLDRKQLMKTSFEERPGPAISSAYNSSSGFTIESAVLPTAYPYMLFKGIGTYGWPSGYWFLHGIIDKIKHIFGLKDSQAMVLNTMGYDNSNGKIMFDKDTNRISFHAPHDPLLQRKIDAFQKLTKKLGGILFMSKYRSTSVHLLGGCNASVDRSNGVCNPNGQVFDDKSPSTTTVHPGLYACDASLIPCSIGINPCLTIATMAEHVSRRLVEDVFEYKGKEDKEFILENVDLKAGPIISSKVVFKETMRGRVGGMPCMAYLKLRMNSKISKDFDKMSLVFGNSHPLLRGKVGGYVVCSAIENDRLHVLDGEVDLCEVDVRAPYTQYMHYRLLLAASSGSKYIIVGKKVMNPYLLGLYGWKESTTMHVRFKKVARNSEREEMVNLKGELHISMVELLKSVISIEGKKRAMFVCRLLLSLLRTYILQVPRGSVQGFTPSEFVQRPYPTSTLHEIKTEDRFIVSCKEWKSNECSSKTVNNPVLLINGYATESSWLPTEPNDLVRTLVQLGHDTWLLQPRLHPSNSSNDFTIEDIARFDIPSVINKILEMNGKSTKVHVVAHCVGGLSIHMALMGGHISATQIASLSCTNSSMFFKLTPSSTFKMWLPLIPMSMAILGKNKTLPLFETLKTSPRQRLLKSIARFMPRYERCTCNECEVLSGVFGNAFWHGNISASLHYWLNKTSLPGLPMAAFPHLRKICNAGFIVDKNGQNKYLIHPERMALPTLYISGGRTLLVTPKTSFLANNYMKLHQPSFRHERVVIDGFGHSDLLIGEESYKKVFPHILSHIGLVERGRISSRVDGKERKYNKEALVWGDDPYEGKEGLGSLISPMNI
ncbi:hypothetical protein LguiB_011561 [Lonicera macranthoides]